MASFLSQALSLVQIIVKLINEKLVRRTGIDLIKFSVLEGVLEAGDVSIAGTQSNASS